MKVNRGKQFEKIFKADWEASFPGTFLYRLQDNTSGYYGASRNPCDFIAFPKNRLFLLEVKSHYGNTFPWSDFRQYDKLLPYAVMPNVVSGVIIWFMDHERVIFVPMETCAQMKQDGLKSININKLNGYQYVEIPSVKKRVFLQSDYTVLEKGE